MRREMVLVRGGVGGSTRAEEQAETLEEGDPVFPVGWDADSSAAQACMLCRDLSSIRTAVRSHVLH